MKLFNCLWDAFETNPSSKSLGENSALEPKRPELESGLRLPLPPGLADGGKTRPSFGARFHHL